jgi:hypothetical protein
MKLLLISIGLILGLSGCAGSSPEVDTKIKKYGLDRNQICKDNKMLLSKNGNCNRFNKITDEHVAYSLSLKQKKEQSKKERKNTRFEKKYGTSQDKYSKCKLAGYTSQQMKDVNHDCMGKEDLESYMSTNTYVGIKLGDPIENYPFLKKSNDNFEKNRISHRAYRCDGDIYFGENDSKKFYVLTRFGLVDTIMVSLGRVGKTAVLDKLKDTYSLFKDKKYYSKYNQFPRVGSTGWLFKNGEDNILYLLSGMYDSTVIYSSNAYNIINLIINEEKEAKKEEARKSKTNAIDSL